MSMIFCRGCGKPIHESAPICPHCGAPQQVQAAPTIKPKVVFAAKPEKPMPEGVKGWSWGGFLLSWIWAIGNNTWIGLLALIPVLGIAMSIILGIKGREWAWQNKQWDSLEHFNRVQRKWSMWGAIVLGGFVLIGVLAAIAVPAYQHYQHRTAPLLDMVTVYKDMQVRDLLKDEIFAKKAIAIVPPASMSCVKGSFDSMRALSLDTANNAISESSGSHADNWITAYVQVSNDAQLDIVVSCNADNSHDDMQFLYFTTRGIDTSLPSGLKAWLNGNCGVDSLCAKQTITIFDGKQQKTLAVAPLVSDLRVQVAAELKPSVTVVDIKNDSFQSVGGLVSIALDDPNSVFGKNLYFSGQLITQFASDSLSLSKAYRYGDHDLIVVYSSCSGSSCTFYSIGLLDVSSDGTATVFNEMSVAHEKGYGDGETIQPQADGSVKINFVGFQGKERWIYTNKTLRRDG